MRMPRYEIVDVTDENVDAYDLLCLKSKSKEEGYKRKLAWFKEYYGKGLRIKLLRILEKKGYASRGFIEYVPGKYCWRGIEARGWTVIHCLWVVGRNKGYGFGGRLLEACMGDAKGTHGVAVVTSEKNWLPGRGIFVKNGFEKADAIGDCELYAKRFVKGAALPRFGQLSRAKLESLGRGLAVFESPQCPYSCGGTAALGKIASRAKMPFTVGQIKSHIEAQKNGLHPYGTYCVVLNGGVASYYPGSVREVAESLSEKR